MLFRSLLTFCFLIASVIAHIISGLLEIPLENNEFSIVDPSRTYISILNLNKNKVDYYHFNKYGEFNIDFVGNGNESCLYKMTINSLDLQFTRTNQFRIVLNNDTITMHEWIPGNHINIQNSMPNLLASSLKIRFTDEVVRLKDYIDFDPSASFINSIPFLPMLLSHPWMLGITIALILLTLMPSILGYIDPEFNERVAEAQEETRLSKKQPKTAEEQ